MNKEQRNQNPHRIKRTRYSTKREHKIYEAKKLRSGATLTKLVDRIKQPMRPVSEQATNRQRDTDEPKKPRPKKPSAEKATLQQQPQCS